MDGITLAYSSLGLQCPIRVRAHSTRGIASSWAWSSGVSILDICEAASWSSPSTFVRFYNLDVPALQARVFSAWVAILWVHLTNIVQASPLLGPYYMDAMYHLRDDTQDTDDPQGSPCAWCILLTPLGLIPRESWFRVVPHHSTVWLDWSNSIECVELNAVRVKYRKGNYSVTIVTVVPWDMGTSTAFLAVLWAAHLSSSFEEIWDAVAQQLII